MECKVKSRSLGETKMKRKEKKKRWEIIPILLAYVIIIGIYLVLLAIGPLVYFSDKILEKSIKKEKEREFK